MKSGGGTRRNRAGLILGLALLLAACGHHRGGDAADEDVNVYPASYRAEILAGMHAYLNDPTGVRDAAISGPMLKSTGFGEPNRYMVCVRFNPKQSATVYAGVREVAAVFLAGRFDRFIDAPKQLCADAAFTPFPELQKLSP
jgi:hypothetical protein